MRLFRDALRVSFDLFKIMVPVIIVVKILQELDLIRYLAIPLGPVMNVVGLPGEMGLVWATAMLSNIYSSIVVLLSLVKDVPITTAQATILGTMILVAHNLPIELKIAQKSGPRLIFQAISRLGSAFLLGWFLNIVYSWFNLLQQPANILLTSKPENALNNESLASWATGEVQKLFFIFLIILGLFFLLRTLEKLKIIDVINKILRPILKLMGIGPKASAITVIGNTMGIAYGGGLIIHEARSGHIDKKDVFYSLTLMGLSHSLIEDTLLMVMIGGHLSGLLCARVGYSILVVTLLVKVTTRLPTAFCDKFLWGKPK
ncbi:MAG: hypothetical protein HQ551_03230 [Desulfobacteraceae bacterium]|nr:hypothetical protein [Desulfobacteraceae bacterium]